MQTTLTIMRPGAPTTIEVVDLPENPCLGLLKAVIQPLLDDADLEHVAVLHDGRRRDMFVDEMRVVRGLPRNDVATAIYRANAIEQTPRINPESLPAIQGPAVLFDRIVWR